MSVILLTVFLSLVLVGLFVVLFLSERKHRGFGSAERDALLPLEEEDSKPSNPVRERNSSRKSDHHGA